MSHALTINHHRRRGARIVVLNSPASSHSHSIGPAPSIVIKSELENTAGWCQKEPNTSPSESVPRTHNQPPSSARRTHRRSEFSCILALPRSIGPAPSIPSSSRASSRILFPCGRSLLGTQRPIQPNPWRYKFAHHHSPIINNITPKIIMDNPANNPDDDTSPTKKIKKRGSSNISRKVKGGKKKRHTAGATTEPFRGTNAASNTSTSIFEGVGDNIIAGPPATKEGKHQRRERSHHDKERRSASKLTNNEEKVWSLVGVANHLDVKMPTCCRRNRTRSSVRCYMVMRNGVPR